MVKARTRSAVQVLVTPLAKFPLQCVSKLSDCLASVHTRGCGRNSDANLRQDDLAEMGKGKKLCAKAFATSF